MHDLMYSFLALFPSGFFLIISLAPILLGVKWALRKKVSPHWMWLGGVNPLLGWIAFAAIRLVIKSKQADASPDFVSRPEIARRQKALRAATIVISTLSALYIGTCFFLGASVFYTEGNRGVFIGFSVSAIAAAVYVYRYIRQLRQDGVTH